MPVFRRSRMRLPNLFRSSKPSRRQHDSLRAKLSLRRSRFETLETRDLLALTVNTADYRALAAGSSLDGSDDSAIWVDSLQDVVNANDGKITLREALDYAAQNLASGETVASTIRFSIGGKITLSNANQSLKVLSKSVTIDASDVGGVTIQGQNSLLLYVVGGTTASPVSATLKNLTFTGGKTTSPSAKGAGVQLGSNCNLIANNCSFLNNASAGSGAGIYVGAGNLTLVDCFVSNNVSQATNGKGGAVYAESGSISASRTTFVDNTATNGGAVYVKSGIASFNDCFFRENRATTGDGGAINSTASVLTVDNASFLKNASGAAGGALYVDGEKESELIDVKFIGNTGVNGGAIYHDGEALAMDHAYFSENQATQNGGALYVGLNAGSKITQGSFSANAASLNGGAVYNEGALYLTGGNFDSNSAQNSGGALYSNYYFEIRDASFFNNQAVKNGGAIYNGSAISSWLLRVSIEDSTANEGAGVYNKGRIKATDSTFSNNASTLYGGGVSNLGDAFIAQSTFDNNKALGLNGAGGALLNYPNATLSLVNSTLYSNAVPEGSGGALANNGTAKIEASTIDENVAGEFGGGVYNGGSLTIQYSTVSYNVANNGGGVANVFGSSSSSVGSTFWGNKAQTNGGAFYCYGPTSFQNCAIAYNVASTTAGAAYYYSPEATSEPDFDSATVLTENVDISSVQPKNLDENVVIIDAQTYEVVDPKVYFGNMAVLDTTTQKSFIVKNVGSQRVRFSDFEEVTNADSSTFNYDLVSSSNNAIDLDNSFVLAPNDFAILTITVSPKKLGSKFVELSWKTTKLSNSGTALQGSDRIVSLAGTAEIAKSGSASTNVATLPDSDANVSFNVDGSFSISLPKAPTEQIIIYLKSSENATLWIQSGDQKVETDALSFSPSNYNVAQTVYVSLNSDYLRENGSIGDVVTVNPQILSNERNWDGASFASIILDVDNYIAFIGDNYVDLNRYADTGTTRWDLNGDGNADVISSGEETWIDSSEVTGDSIVSYRTKNSVTTKTTFDAPVVNSIPSATGRLSTFEQTPGMVRLDVESNATVVQRWRVDWGDGSPNTELNELSSSQTFAHYYAEDGDYQISVELVDVSGLGADCWSSVGKASITGIAQSSSALLAIVDENNSDDLEKATEEIALTMQNSVVEEKASATNFVATDLVQDLFGPRDLRKKASRPLNLL